MHDTFAAGTLRDEYFVLSSKRQVDVPPNTIWVTDDGVRTGASAAGLKQLDPQDYLVLQIEVADERDDWRSLSAIAEPLEAALQAKFEGDDNKSKLLVSQAKLAAIKSPDLTRLDMQRVIAGIDKEMGAPGAAALGGESALKRAVSRVSKAEAAALPPLDEDALLSTLSA